MNRLLLIMLELYGNRLFIERNEEFAVHQDTKFGPIHQDMNMKTCKLKEDSMSMLKLTK